MSTWQPIKVYMGDHHEAISALAEQLGLGSLAAWLGAGISIPLKLPAWWKLVKNCRKIAGLPANQIRRSSSNENLRLAMDDVERDRTRGQYTQILRDALYLAVGKGGSKRDEKILENRLLVVLGALLMRSGRGSIQRVLTFNFDDCIERYLRLNGFDAESVVELPRLNRDVDVLVYHSHGYVPSDPAFGNASKRLIFSQYSYDEHQAGTDPFYDFSYRMLIENVVLFVGLSKNDPTLGQFLMRAKKTIGSERPLGFWLIGPNDPKSTESFLCDRQVVPIRMKNYDGYWRFLLKVCQEAAKRNIQA